MIQILIKKHIFGLGHDMIKQIMRRKRLFKILQYFHKFEKEKELRKDHSDYNIKKKNWNHWLIT